MGEVLYNILIFLGIILLGYELYKICSKLNIISRIPKELFELLKTYPESPTFYTFNENLNFKKEKTKFWLYLKELVEKELQKSSDEFFDSLQENK